MSTNTEITVRKRGRPRKHSGLAFGEALKVQRSGLHEQAANRIRDMIVKGELSPGALLLEGELSSALGISRTPLREAVKLLALQGLVELRANRSACVRPLRLVEIEELFEALGGLEQFAARLAAERITSSELAELRELQGAIERHHAARERSEYYAANRAIHAAIVRAARNTTLAEMHATLLTRSEQVRFFALRLEGRWEQSIEEHRDILDALEKHDGERASCLLSIHVGHTAQVVARSFAADPKISQRVA